MDRIVGKAGVYARNVNGQATSELRPGRGFENRGVDDLWRRHEITQALPEIASRLVVGLQADKVSKVNATMKLERYLAAREEDAKLIQKSSPSSVSKIPLTPPL